MKQLVIALATVFGCSSAWAGMQEWSCNGKFDDGEGESKIISFSFMQLSGLDDESERSKLVNQILLSEEVFIEPTLLCEDTSKWDIDKITNFKTNLITDYPEADCGTAGNRNPRVFFDTKVVRGMLELDATITGGDGMGDSVTIKGSCIETKDDGHSN